MGTFHVIGFVVAVLFACNYVSGFKNGYCPSPSRVYNEKPKCYSDADCQKWGKLCCRNQFNSMSCTDRAPYTTSADYNDRYNGVHGGAGGVYCAGVKCMPYEVCRADPFTKRLRCQRP